MTSVSVFHQKMSPCQRVLSLIQHSQRALGNIEAIALATTQDAYLFK